MDITPVAIRLVSPFPMGEFPLERLNPEFGGRNSPHRFRIYARGEPMWRITGTYEAITHSLVVGPGNPARWSEHLLSGFYGGNFPRFQPSLPLGSLPRFSPVLIELNDPFAGAVQMVPIRNTNVFFPLCHPLITF